MKSSELLYMQKTVKKTARHGTTEIVQKIGHRVWDSELILTPYDCNRVTSDALKAPDYCLGDVMHCYRYLGGSSLHWTRAVLHSCSWIKPSSLVDQVSLRSGPLISEPLLRNIYFPPQRLQVRRGNNQGLEHCVSLIIKMPYILW